MVNCGGVTLVSVFEEQFLLGLMPISVSAALSKRRGLNASGTQSGSHVTDAGMSCQLLCSIGAFLCLKSKLWRPIMFKCAASIYIFFVTAYLFMEKVMPALCSRLFLFVATFLLMSNVWAEDIAATETGSTAHAVVTKVTEDTISVIQQNKALLTENPSAYFAKVQAVLEPVVMFDFIAKTVMGNTYAKASPAQRETFATVFKQGMVETFAKGMANYSDFEINVLPPKADQSGQRKIEVLQEVKGKDGTLTVSYTMASTKDGEWKLINVVLNGVNLGKSFRDQFTQAMRQHNSDIDKVIANWWQKDA